MKNNKIDVKIIRSKRKTVGLEIHPDLCVVVRAPLRMTNRQIEQLLDARREWIEKNLARMAAKEKKEKPQEPVLTELQIRQLYQMAQQELPKRVHYWSDKMGLTYGRITIRMQKTRWGSCSSKGNLNFNCLLMLTPPEVQDYVVVHELCHRVEMNHSSKFWNQVEMWLPEYRKQKNWLRNNGNSIMRRVFAK